jgi:hypothetical protein
MSDITINEVRRRLQEFAKEHENDRGEKQFAQQFMRDFYSCFGLSKSSASMFEKKIIKLNNRNGFIDSFIPGVLLVEQKTTGSKLEKAYKQAIDYALALENEFEKPQYILICDFQTFHLYNLHGLDKEPLVCTLSEISNRADWFMFLVDKRVVAYSEELPINRKAAEQIADLHDALLSVNYIGRDLETFLTRLIFCLFADDTGIFGDNGIFKKLVERSKEDGSDLGSAISLLFQVLNTPTEMRQTNLDEELQAFEYINGQLFEEQIQIPYFDYKLRQIIYNSSKLDWSGISPAIFGAMFQAVLESGASDKAHRKESRRELGAHYTSERNILKVIQPLFLDELFDEFNKAKGSKNKLKSLYDKLQTLKFLDPACGCGNFLVIAYRELRRIENDVIAELFFKGEQGGLLDISTLCRVSVEQFYGIEIDEAATHIARVAMYITDHQLNIEAGIRFGEVRATVPLTSTPNIIKKNAITLDWNLLIKAKDCHYVLGNPPFAGYKEKTKDQKSESDLMFGHIQGAGVLDYVCNWYKKTVNFINENPKIECAFVSTNSITQGEQPAILWKELLKHGIVINFAHKTFIWKNEGKGVAAVHCVIIGFSKLNYKFKKLFTYYKNKNEPELNTVDRINAYLIEADNILLEKRRETISINAPLIFRGSQPTDGGHLLLDDFEKEQLLKLEPNANKFIRKFLMGEEFINGISRWCLWLTDSTPDQFLNLPEIKKRLGLVREMRLLSSKKATQKLASTPYLFGEIKQPKTRYLALPIVSSEKRLYIPIAYLEPEIISGNKLFCIPDATLSDLSVVTSSMHMAWMRTVSGRLKSDYSYSNLIVFNNFPWTSTELDDKSINSLSSAAQAILDARAFYPNSSLADLYNPLNMPVELVKAHNANNKAVDKAYGYTGSDDDASRVAFLFKKYEELTSLLPSATVKKKHVKKSVKLIKD